MKFDVYTLQNDHWKYALSKIPAHLQDISYSPQWYRSWQDHEQAEAMCIHFEYDEFTFLYPFFRKKISNYNLKLDYFDIQTAYGYGGVLANKQEIPAHAGEIFNRITTEWLTDNRIIAEFIREHPLLNNVKRSAEYITVRKNVYVDITDAYRIPDKNARHNVDRALRSNCTIMYDRECRYMDVFAGLYHETTERLRMHPFYRFSAGYFFDLKKHLGDNLILIHIVNNGIIISSGLLIKHHEKGNLHLTASRVEYQILRANDLLYYATISYCLQNGIKILNTGGGLGNDPNDSLFRFKTKFGRNIKEVRIGKQVHNTGIYNQITAVWEMRHPDLITKYRNFFLKYHQEA